MSNPHVRLAFRIAELHLLAVANRNRYVTGSSPWQYHDGQANAFRWLRERFANGDLEEAVREMQTPVELEGGR